MTDNEKTLKPCSLDFTEPPEVIYVCGRMTINGKSEVGMWSEDHPSNSMGRYTRAEPAPTSGSVETVRAALGNIIATLELVCADIHQTPLAAQNVKDILHMTIIRIDAAKTHLPNLMDKFIKELEGMRVLPEERGGESTLLDEHAIGGNDIIEKIIKLAGEV